MNVVGLEREGFSIEQIGEIKQAFVKLFRSCELNRAKCLDELERQQDVSPEVKYLLAFLRNVDRGKLGRYRESLRSLEPKMNN